jgi:hypothetical protein
MLAVHRRTNRVFAEPDHAAATDGRERGVLPQRAAANILESSFDADGLVLRALKYAAGVEHIMTYLSDAR